MLYIVYEISLLLDYTDYEGRTWHLTFESGSAAGTVDCVILESFRMIPKRRMSLLYLHCVLEEINLYTLINVMLMYISWMTMVSYPNALLVYHASHGFLYMHVVKGGLYF